jgi:hypothetical protein
MIMDKAAVAIRQRRHRDRRHRGFFCVTVEIGADDIGRLIDRGLLDRMHQDDPDQVQQALHAFLEPNARWRCESRVTRKFLWPHRAVAEAAGGGRLEPPGGCAGRYFVLDAR